MYEDHKYHTHRKHFVFVLKNLWYTKLNFCVEFFNIVECNLI